MAPYRDDDAFNRLTEDWDNQPDAYDVPEASAAPATGPYGGRAPQVKPGLTPRGKALLAVGAAVLAGGGILGYQSYSADAAEAQVKAQELALKERSIALEEMKEYNRAHEREAKAQSSADKAAEKQIAACIDADKKLVGKQLGVSYASVTEDCKNQYAPNADSPNMQAAASATDTATGGGGLSPSALAGIGVGAVVVVGVAATRGRKTNAA